MFAVIKTGGKQYKVSEADVVEIEKLEGEPGETVTFGEVLLTSSGKAGGAVEGKIVAQKKGPKIVIMKHRRRKNSRKKTGHRQNLTLVQITSITEG